LRSRWRPRRTWLKRASALPAGRSAGRSRAGGGPRSRRSTVDCGLDVCDRRWRVEVRMLYLGSFSFDERFRHENRAGNFQIAAEAATVERAVDLFGERLDAIRAAGTLFDRAATVYLDGIVALDRVAPALLVNFESREIDVDRGGISCLL